MRVLAVLFAAVITLTACGESELDLVTEVSNAGAATLEADSARTSFTTTALGQEVTFDGVFDFAARRAELTASAAALGLTGDDTTFVFDYADRMVMFVALPPQETAELGAQWLEFDLGAAMEQAGIDADIAEIIQAQSSDPTSALQFLRGASVVTELGTEVIRETETRQLEVVVDLQKLVEESPEEIRDDMAKLVDLYTVDTMTVLVWIDGDDRVRRFRQEIDYSTFELPGDPDLGALAGQTITVEAEYYDFGAPVDIQLPDPSETVTFEEIMAKAMAGG